MSYFQFDGSQIYYEKVGTGEPLLLLHGNTASSKMFAQIIPTISERYTVFTMDFLGCGQSDRLEEWPFDLWFQWSEQVAALCRHNHLGKVYVIGCSGGAIATINFALEYPDMVHAVVADSFEGITANASVTEQIRMGRSFAKQNEGFCKMLKVMHGDDWESVLDADTEAVVGHAQHIGKFFHKSLSQMKPKLLLTGSNEDEMFPKGHYEKLFAEICSQTSNASMHIFENGGHPAMISNATEFLALSEKFFAESRKCNSHRGGKGKANAIFI
ncbi:4,5:9,10-diseco-3-hydroxy-5,9,17-trioxoandrosta-1(10),2-diene-4-oate hydrolase [anaerobic digester metagenome]